MGIQLPGLLLQFKEAYRATGLEMDSHNGEEVRTG